MLSYLSELGSLEINYILKTEIHFWNYGPSLKILASFQYVV